MEFSNLLNFNIVAHIPLGAKMYQLDNDVPAEYPVC